MDYVEDFAYYLKNERTLRESTIDSYIRDIRNFYEYVYKSNLSVKSVTAPKIAIYLGFLKKNGRAKTTISRNLASIRSYFHFLENKEYIDENPTLNLEVPKVEKRLPSVLTKKEIRTLLDQPDINGIKGLRDKTMMELLYATGVKVSELVFFDIDDIDVYNSVVNCRSSINKHRTVPMGSICLKYIKLYLDDVRNKFAPKEDEKALFLNFSGKRLTRQGFWKIVKQYTEKANISKTITPQTLRHSFAVHLIENGADLESLKEMLGHADISTTQIYNKINDDKIRRVYDKTHPRA